MTVNDGIVGLKYFTVSMPETPHSGNETAVFTHLRNETQLAISAIRADLIRLMLIQHGCFEVQPGV